MAHVEPLARTELAALEPVLAGAEAAMGFVPNSMMTWMGVFGPAFDSTLVILINRNG